MTVSALANTPSPLHDSDLSRIANLVTVGHIFNKFIATFTTDQLAEDVWEQWEEKFCDNQSPLDQMALVERQGKPAGILTFDALVDVNGKQLSEFMEEIHLDSLITVDTPLTRAIEMFSNKSAEYFFVVIRGNEFVGFLSYNDLDKLPFRLCLFAQLLATEQKMFLVAQKDSLRAFAKLRRKRRDRAEHSYVTSGHKDDLEEHQRAATLLPYTTFDDKVTILQECCKVSLQIPSVANKDWTKLATTIRNELVHEKKPLFSLIERERFPGFIKWLLRLDLELKTFLESNASELD